MELHAWIQLGIFGVAIASACGAVIAAINRRVDARADKMDLQFGKIDIKFDNITMQIDRLRDIGNDRHIANIERMSRLEGHISALKVIEPIKKDNG